MKEWAVLLEKGVSAITSVLEGEDEKSIMLRSSSPFTGIVSQKERMDIIKKCKGATKGIFKNVEAGKYSDEESLLSAISSDSSKGLKKLLETDAPWEYIVPLSRFRRELNKWIKLIEKYNHTVKITKNNKIIGYAVPYGEKNE